MAMNGHIEEKVREPYEYTRKLPGKSLRSKLIETFNEWICADEGDRILISSVIEILHNASLMIDDIEDASEYRRGQVCAYKKFGIPLTLNSANLAYFEALKLLQACADHSADLTAIFTEEMINLHVGQGSEIYFRDQGSVASPKIEEYYKICSLKTGGLFRLFTRLLLKCSKKTIDVETEKWIIGLAEDLGKFYQVRDDYLNIFKGDASDLIEGKFTLPTIFAEIKNIKNQKSEDILDTLRAVEADKFCLRTLSEFAEEMENLIFEIEQKTERQNNLKDVINSLL